MAKKSAVEKTAKEKVVKNEVDVDVDVDVEEKVAENAVETPAPQKEEKKYIRFSSERSVIVRNKSFAGKKLCIGSEIVEFDADGCVKINGLEAKRLVTIPGFEAIG